MGLKHLTVPEATVKTPGGDFTVRGISLDDISYLVARHGKAIGMLYSKVEGNSESDMDIGSVITPALQYAPELLADVIACATGDKDDAAIARSLPMPVQVDAVEKIADLTFSASGGFSNFVETVTRIVQGATGLYGNLSGQQA